MLEIGVPAMRTISLSFVVAGLSVSIARQLIVLIPVAYLLSRTGNVNIVWFAIPISDILSFILTMFFFRKVNRTVIDHIGEKESYIKYPIDNPILFFIMNI